MNKIIHHAMALALFFLLASCASVPYGPYSTGHNSLGETRQWSMRLFPEPGQIRIEAQLQHGSETRISLSATKIKDPMTPVSIFFTDEKCDSGHQIAVDYYGASTEILSKYFDTVIPWGHDATVMIEWGNDGQFSITINGETVSAKTYQKFDSAEIKSAHGPVNIKNLQYVKLPQAKPTSSQERI